MTNALAGLCSWPASRGPPLSSPAVPEPDIVVNVTKEGPAYLIDVDCPVRAPLAVIWAVLTDYDNMHTFISNLQESRVETRVGNVLTVRQRGKTSLGRFSVEFDGVREIEIVPLVEIRSRYLSGDLKSSTFTTRVAGAEGSFHIINTGRLTPNRWMPPLIGPTLIAAETRKQFDEFRQEILRRSARLPVSPAPGSGLSPPATTPRPLPRNWHVGRVRRRDETPLTGTRWRRLQAPRRQFLKMRRRSTHSNTGAVRHDA